MAKALGLSRMAVNRIWRAFGLQPHRSETFKLPKDPLLVEKVRDIVGLYLNPPSCGGLGGARWSATERNCHLIMTLNTGARWKFCDSIRVCLMLPAEDGWNS